MFIVLYSTCYIHSVSDWGKMLMCDCYVFSSGRKIQIYMESGGRAGPRKSRRDTLLGYGNAVSTKGNVHDGNMANCVFLKCYETQYI